MQTLQTSKQTSATLQEDILFTSHHPLPVCYLTDSGIYLLRKVEPRLILCASCLCRLNTRFARHRAAASLVLVQRHLGCPFLFYLAYLFAFSIDGPGAYSTCRL